MTYLEQVVAKILERHEYPGSVEQLEAEVSQLIGIIPEPPIAVSYRVGPLVLFGARRIAAERSAIERTLLDTGGNRKEAADRLGLKRTTLTMRMRKLGLPMDGNQLAGHRRSEAARRGDRSTKASPTALPPPRSVTAAPGSKEYYRQMQKAATKISANIREHGTSTLGSRS